MFRTLFNEAWEIFDWITFIPAGLFFAFMYSWAMAPAPDGLDIHPWIVCILAACVWTPLDLAINKWDADWYAWTQQIGGGDNSVFNTMWYCVALPWFGYWWFLNDGYTDLINWF